MLWWKDLVRKLYDNSPPNVPVALALMPYVATGKVSQNWIRQMIRVREDFPSVRDIETEQELGFYNEGMFSSVLYLSLECAGEGQTADPANPEPVHSDESQADNVTVSHHLASHLGQAIGIATLIRSLPRQAQNDRMFIPDDLAQRFQLDMDQVAAGMGTTQGLQDCIFHLAAQAKSHINHARSREAEVSAAAKSIFLNITPAEMYLDKLQQYQFDVFHPELQTWAAGKTRTAPIELRWELKKKSFKGTF
jgi:phytoene/squalene synthetase